MIKKTLAISERPAYLKLQNQQLIAHLPEMMNHPEEKRQYPIEDLGVLLLEHPQITITQALLQALGEAGVVTIICAKNHLPESLLLPLTKHTELVPRLHLQINLKETRRKQLWQNIIKQKIWSQQTQLASWGAKEEERKLLRLSDSVKTGDREKNEAQAAGIYWKFFFKQFTEGKIPRRDTSSLDSWNGSLNYGYAIIRAATARAIVSAGFQPSLGIFHHRQGNAYCLADDLMEPFRSLVDRYLSQNRDLLNETSSGIPNEVKKCLLNLLVHPTLFRGKQGPLSVNLSRYMSSFHYCLQGETQKLEFPLPI